MEESVVSAVCLNCDRSEAEVPLLQLRFQGGEILICSRCLPVLIHKTEQLVGRLSGADEIEPSPHEH